MFNSEKYRDLSYDYGALAGSADSATKISGFRNLQKSALMLAENEEWLRENYERTLHPDAKAAPSRSEFASEEEHVLRCLGAALLMQWNEIPASMQRQLFDNAGAMGELRSTAELRGQIARFLDRYKDGVRSGDRLASAPDACAVSNWENEGDSANRDDPTALASNARVVSSPEL